MNTRIPTRTVIFCCLSGMLLLAGCNSRKSEAAAPETAPPTSAADTAVATDAAPSAMEEFKSGVESISTWLDERHKRSATTPPPPPAATMSEFVTKAKALKSDGLPADLTKAWADFLAVMTEVDALFQTLPTPEPTDPQAKMEAMAGIKPQLMALAQKAGPLVKTLAEVGKKHGIENLEKLGPGGPPPRVEEK